MRGTAEIRRPEQVLNKETEQTGKPQEHERSPCTYNKVATPAALWTSRLQEAGAKTKWTVKSIKAYCNYNTDKTLNAL